MAFVVRVSTTSSNLPPFRSHILVPSTEALFTDAKDLNGFRIPALQTTINGMAHDLDNGVPAKPEQKDAKARVLAQCCSICTTMASNNRVNRECLSA